MDPISILGAAAAIAQFIDFAAKILGTSSKIFKSSRGASADNLTLEDASTALRDLSQKLASQAQTGLKETELTSGNNNYPNLADDDFMNETGLSSSYENFVSPDSALRKIWQRQAKKVELQRKLSDLSDQCRSDCDSLLGLLENLRVNDCKNRLWHSVKAGLRTTLKAHEIDQLERKLERTQNLMMLYVGELTR